MKYIHYPEQQGHTHTRTHLIIYLTNQMKATFNRARIQYRISLSASYTYQL